MTGILHQKSNITLVGMPGAGKSTIGVILAKFFSFGFMDTDVLIQTHHRKTLQEILDATDYLHLRRIEEAEILKINVENHVIATGGSAIYSEKAMNHLKNQSNIIFLKVDQDLLRSRIHNFTTRGIAKSAHQTFAELYRERQALYETYAEAIVDCGRRDQEEIAQIIWETWRGAK